MINVQFSVTSQATDTSLLTIEEMRSAVGISNSDSDSDLETLADQVTEEIMNACGIARYSNYPPTLRVESLSETMRQVWTSDVESKSPKSILLYRKPIISIESLVVDDETFVLDTNYMINKSQGKIIRLWDDYISTFWWFRKLVINYTAGWEIVPPGLKLAAQQLLNIYWQQGTRDLGVKEVDVPGVRRTVYDTSGNAGTLGYIPNDVMQLLSPYMNRKLS